MVNNIVINVAIEIFCLESICMLPVCWIECIENRLHDSMLLVYQPNWKKKKNYPDSKIHGANMGPTWVLSAPDGPHVGPMNLAIWVGLPNQALLCEA